MIKASTKEELGGLSLNRILLEITNFQGFEAENEIAWNKLLNKIDFGTKKTKTPIHKDARETSERGRMGKSFRDLLVNDNVVIIDKTPSQLRKRNSSPRIQEKTKNSDDVNDKKPIAKQEMPEPNVVQRVKDIFETLYLEPNTKDVQQKDKVRKPINRSKSLCTPTSNYREQYLENNAKSKNHCTNKQTVTTDDGTAETQTKERNDCCGFRSEDEEKREWLNGCSPVTPEVIQKIREHGTSMTFFGRPAYSTQSSPIFMNESYIQPYDANWPKPKIIKSTFKYNGRSLSSLCSSSVSSEDDGFDSLNHNAPDIFDDGFYYYSVLSSCDDRSSSPEDCYSYDIVYLNEKYSRSSTPQLGIMNKGIWLRDPYWRGSSYIIYDFRGTDVKSHIRGKND